MAVGQGSNSAVNADHQNMVNSSQILGDYADGFNKLMQNVGLECQTAAGTNHGDYATAIFGAFSTWGEQFRRVNGSLIGIQGMLNETIKKYNETHQNNTDQAQSYNSQVGAVNMQLPGFSV